MLLLVKILNHYQLGKNIRASMEKAIPEEDIKQIPIWQGKTEDFSKMFGLR